MDPLVRLLHLQLSTLSPCPRFLCSCLVLAPKIQPKRCVPNMPLFFCASSCPRSLWSPNCSLSPALKIKPRGCVSNRPLNGDPSVPCRRSQQSPCTSKTVGLSDSKCRPKWSPYRPTKQGCKWRLRTKENNCIWEIWMDFSSWVKQVWSTAVDMDSDWLIFVSCWDYSTQLLSLTKQPMRTWAVGPNCYGRTLVAHWKALLLKVIPFWVANPQSLEIWMCTVSKVFRTKQLA